ncbi:MAG: hypothetical protein ACLTCP_07885 [Ruminococcus bicirculans (ex Wegman et al. 2014)]
MKLTLNYMKNVIKFTENPWNNRPMERVERTQKMMNKSNNRIVNDKISSADIGRAKKEQKIWKRFS